MPKSHINASILFLLFATLVSCGQAEVNRRAGPSSDSADSVAEQLNGEVDESLNQNEDELLEEGDPEADETDLERSEEDSDSDSDDDTVQDQDLEEEISLEIPRKWKTLLFTGDNSIRAFDNAAEDLSEMFLNNGIAEENLRRLSMTSHIYNSDAEIERSSRDNIRKSLAELQITDDDNCLIHMTSHGSRSGFYMVNQSEIKPSELDAIIDSACKDKPTVMLISACYSGINSNSPSMQKPNRIILTAARSDRTSFGCSPEADYTYWDGCLLDHLESSSGWEDLYDNVTSCIERKEAGMFTPSFPQVFVGSKMKDFDYPFAPQRLSH